MMSITEKNLITPFKKIHRLLDHLESTRSIQLDSTTIRAFKDAVNGLCELEHSFAFSRYPERVDLFKRNYDHYFDSYNEDLTRFRNWQKILKECLHDIRSDYRCYLDDEHLRSKRLVRDRKFKIQKFVGRIFDEHSKLLVIRIDLGYGSEHATDEIDLVRDDLDRFIRHLRYVYGSNLVGYLYKVEYGYHKKFHVHAMLYLNGHKHQKDGSITNQIGGYWLNEITQGDGVYHGCNLNKHSYKRLGIGMIHYHDKEMIQANIEAANYLGKDDDLTPIVLADTYGRKTLPRLFNTSHAEFSKSNRGRPRLRP